MKRVRLNVIILLQISGFKKPPISLCVCIIEVFSSGFVQHHHWGSEGAQRHRGSAAGSRGRRAIPTPHSLPASRQRPQEAGSTVLQTGGECEFMNFVHCTSYYTRIKIHKILIILCCTAGVCGSRVGLQSGSRAQRPGGVCQGNLQLHVRYGAVLPGGAGGISSGQGPTVGATGGLKLDTE